MSRLLTLLVLSVAPFAALPVSAQRVASVSNVEGVKIYLLTTLQLVDRAAAEFVANSTAYAQIIEAHRGDYPRAFAAAGPELRAIIAKMQENYKAMDSFGYERVEGIVAGVPRLADFDIYLDAGVPKAEASADSPAAPVTLDLGNGRKIVEEGSLFTYIIEPTLWGTQPRFVVPLDLNGDGAVGPRESLPKAEVLTAAAKDVRAKIAELIKTSRNWKPTVEDCFGAIIAMTPTLSGYFDDWKESRYAPETSGRFTAVSRVSDMRGIMESVSVLYDAVHLKVSERDGALAKTIKAGFTNILAFIDRVEAREKKAGGKLTPAEIEELTSQAKEKSDKLVPQVEQAAAILNVKLAG
jgi:imelysin